MDVEGHGHSVWSPKPRSSLESRPLTFNSAHVTMFTHTYPLLLFSRYLERAIVVRAQVQDPLAETTGCGHSGTSSVGANWASTNEICVENMDGCEYAY